MESILISVSPKDCELIVDGKKEILVQKTCPIVKTPFKCYIYCMKKDYEKCFYQDKFMHKIFLQGQAKGKVIGEFVCDEMYDLIYVPGWDKEWFFFSHHEKSIEDSQDLNAQELLLNTCLSMDDIIDYSGKKRVSYGWHISDLKIYDKPKELGEFNRFCPPAVPNCEACRYSINEELPFGKLSIGCDRGLTSPPQSWCYINGII